MSSPCREGDTPRSGLEAQFPTGLPRAPRPPWWLGRVYSTTSTSAIPATSRDGHYRTGWSVRPRTPRRRAADLPRAARGGSRHWRGQRHPSGSVTGARCAWLVVCVMTMAPREVVWVRAEMDEGLPCGVTAWGRSPPGGVDERQRRRGRDGVNVGCGRASAVAPAEVACVVAVVSVHDEANVGSTLFLR